MLPNANIKELISIYPHIGYDSYKKLMFIAEQFYPEWANEGKKSGEELNRTLSFCIEATYNYLQDNGKKPHINDVLPPPKTMKAQLLYGIYQLITTMRNEGQTEQQMLSHLNQQRLPTPDDIIKPIQLTNRKPSRWVVNDLLFLFKDDGLPSEWLRNYLDDLNARTQRVKHIMPQPDGTKSR